MEDRYSKVIWKLSSLLLTLAYYVGKLYRVNHRSMKFKHCKLCIHSLNEVSCDIYYPMSYACDKCWYLHGPLGMWCNFWWKVEHILQDIQNRVISTPNDDWEPELP